MSQITRCPSCATLFKVVPDQLRISDGWVRCGQCQEVFDATLSLQEAPAPVLPPGSVSEGHTTTAAAVASAWSGDAAQSVCATDAVAVPATAALFKDTEPSVQSAEMPVDDTTPGAEQIPVEDKAAKQAATPELPAALPAPDVVLVLDEPSVHGPQQPAGYELPAALLARTDEEEKWSTEAASDEFPLCQPPLSAEPEKSIDAPAGVMEEPPFTPAFKAESLAEDQAGAEPEGFFINSVAATLDKKTDSDHSDDRAQSRFTDAAEHEETVLSLPETAFASGTPDLSETLQEESAQPLPVAHEEPSFVRSARRNALWHRPAVRLALGAVGLLLVAVLLLQVAVQQRHYLAGAQPQWRPALEALCVPLQCEVRPYQHIASVVVDGSAFNKLRGNTYRFALVLKNQSGVPVALPAVELTLTDTSDQPVLRRVLTPSELAAPAALPAGGEWSGSLEVDVALAGDAPAQIAGYRVLAFYP